MSTSLSIAAVVLVAVGLHLSTAASWSAPAVVHHANESAKRSEHSVAHSSRSKHQTTRHVVAHRGGKSWLVPPPPAYLPSVLPELYGRQSQTTDAPEAEVADDDSEVKKPENPYKKYIYTPEGVAPQPIQNRKGVTTWSQRS